MSEVITEGPAVQTEEVSVWCIVVKWGSEVQMQIFNFKQCKSLVPYAMEN